MMQFVQHLFCPECHATMALIASNVAPVWRVAQCAIGKLWAPR